MCVCKLCVLFVHQVAFLLISEGKKSDADVGKL